jgi:hypothetical protein
MVVEKVWIVVFLKNKIKCYSDVTLCAFTRGRLKKCGDLASVAISPKLTTHRVTSLKHSAPEYNAQQQQQQQQHKMFNSVISTFSRQRQGQTFFVWDLHPRIKRHVNEV